MSSSIASEESLKWRELTANFDDLVLSTTCHPEKFSSRCISVPIVTSATFAKSDQDFEYGRYGNPTRNILENALAELDGAKYGLAFASGSAALSSVIESIVGYKDHIVTMGAHYGSAYGGTTVDSARFGIKVDYSFSGKCEEIMKLVNKDTKIIWLETPSNPTLHIAEVESIVKAAKALNQGIIVVLDNTVSTPIFQRPLDLGVDIVVYSCSKFYGGHGDLIAGAVTLNSDEYYKKIHKYQQTRGAPLGPFDCYLLIRSIKTLPLRMRQHEKNALKIAKFLEKHPKVEKIMHPGLPSHPDHKLALKQQFGHTGLVGIYIKDGKLEDSQKFLANLKVIKDTSSMGIDTSNAVIAIITSHYALPKEELAKMGITDNYIRLSTGLEGVESLISDLDQALLNI